MSSEALDLLSLDPLNTCSWTSFNCHLVWSYQYILTIVCMSSGWAEAFLHGKADAFNHTGKEIVRKSVSHLRYIFYNFQWSRHPLHWANHISLNGTPVTSWSYHWLHHPKSSGKVKRTDGKNWIQEEHVLTTWSYMNWRGCSNVLFLQI